MHRSNIGIPSFTQCLSLRIGRPLPSTFSSTLPTGGSILPSVLMLPVPIDRLCCQGNRLEQEERLQSKLSLALPFLRGQHWLSPVQIADRQFSTVPSFRAFNGIRLAIESVLVDRRVRPVLASTKQYSPDYCLKRWRFCNEYRSGGTNGKVLAIASFRCR